MRKPASMKALEELGRVRLSEHFFMREMLYSEIANFHGIPNIPDDPDLAIAAGTRLCEELLEPLHATFGHVSVRSAFRSVEVNTYGAERQDKGYSCGKTDWNRSRHVWDRRDAEGMHGGDRLHRHPLVHPPLRSRHSVACAGLVDTRPPALFGHDVLRREGEELRVQSAMAREAGPPVSRPMPRTGFSSPNRGWRTTRAITARSIPGSRSSGAADGAVLPLSNRGAGARTTGSRCPEGRLHPRRVGAVARHTGLLSLAWEEIVCGRGGWLRSGREVAPQAVGSVGAQ